jgi:hypothetical protein
MLKRFTVKGYKNFRNDVTIFFDDVRVYQFNTDCVKNGLINTSLIYGKNAVGKTNLGAAILDVKSNLIRREEQFAGKRGSDFLNADMDGSSASFAYAFLIEDSEITYTYEKDGQMNLLSESLTINGRDAFFYDYVKRSKDVDEELIASGQNLNWEFFDDEISVLSYIANSIPDDGDSVVIKLVRFIKKMFMITGDNFPLPRIPKSWTDEELDALNEFMSLGVDEKIISLATPDGNSELYFQHKRPVLFRENASSGTSALFRLFRYISLYDRVFIYYDEFDAFFHHELSEKVISMLKGSGIQTVLTTHNTNLFSNRHMRPDCLFILSPDKIVPINAATQRELRQGHNLEKLYLSGEFNG